MSTLTGLDLICHHCNGFGWRLVKYYPMLASRDGVIRLAYQHIETREEKCPYCDQGIYVTARQLGMRRD